MALIGFSAFASAVPRTHAAPVRMNAPILSCSPPVTQQIRYYTILCVTLLRYTAWSLNLTLVVCLALCYTFGVESICCRGIYHILDTLGLRRIQCMRGCTLHHMACTFCTMYRIVGNCRNMIHGMPFDRGYSGRQLVHSTHWLSMTLYGVVSYGMLLLGGCEHSVTTRMVHVMPIRLRSTHCTASPC